MSQKGLTPLIAITIIGIVLGGYFIYQNYINSSLSQLQPNQTVQSDNSQGMKTYTNSRFNYSYKYPNNFVQHPNRGEHVFYSEDAKFELGGSQIAGINIGSVVYGPGEDIENYIGPNAQIDDSVVSNIKLLTGVTAKAYANEGDTRDKNSITVIINYKENNQDMRIMLWCGGDNSRCRNLLMQVLQTFQFTSS